MTTKMLPGKRRRWPVEPDVLANARASVARATGVRIDTKLLDEDERHRLVGLVRKIEASAEPGAIACDPDALGARERKTYERLVAKAGGLPSNHFAKAREDAKLQARVEELAREAMRPAPRPRYEEPGSVTFPKETYDLLRRGAIWLEDIAVLYLLTACFELAEAPPKTAFETDE